MPRRNAFRGRKSEEPERRRARVCEVRPSVRVPPAPALPGAAQAAPRLLSVETARRETARAAHLHSVSSQRSSRCSW